MGADVPPLRSRPVATMKDMGMDMAGMDMAGASGGTIDLSKPDGGMVGMDHGAMGPDMAAGAAGAVAGMPPQVGAGMAGMDHSALGGMNMRDPKNAPQVRTGPGVQAHSPMGLACPGERSEDPPVGPECCSKVKTRFRPL